ncbi:Gluconolactonase [Lasiodiplodia hormozganensis]|uniref:Gluconolactonase n=1 Tax=Lasiodiplodia hormozganensis TaxID=869390 RepID=A0AA39Y857_9PEZI|nr:Gluconolactonase [Lasiodiplodia hormozganensis]
MEYPFSETTGESTAANSTDLLSPAVQNASFVVFDPRGREILGDAPSLEHIFSTTPNVIQEAPVYVPELNAIIFSTFSPDVYPQSIIYLNETKPRLETFYADPPVWGVNGGRYRDGKVYWAVAGSGEARGPNNKTVGQAPGIYEVDPITRKSSVLVNNYFGVQFNSPDDLVIDNNGDIYFTDPWYGWAMGYSPTPALHPSTWRFRPSTGAVSVVDNTVNQPNGIGMSPDGSMLYITDGGNDIVNDTISGIVYSSTNTHCVWAFNTNPSPAGKWLTHRRPMWCTESVGHDGFHVAGNGYLVGAAGTGVDIISEWGELLLRIQTDFTVNNVQFAGPELDELWLFGMGSISRVRWNLTGMPEARS